MERLELAGDPPKSGDKRKSEIPLNQLEVLIEQKRKEGNIWWIAYSLNFSNYDLTNNYIARVKEQQESLSKDDKLKAAKERMMARKRQKLN